MFLQTLDLLSHEMGQDEYKALVCIIMTHGSTHDVLCCSDDKSVTVPQVLSSFRAVKGKPKASPGLKKLFQQLTKV